MTQIHRISLLCCAFVMLSAPVLGQDTLWQESGAPRETYLFQVVLLIGDNEGGSSYDGVPKNAMSALEDIRDFLPFKNYRLLDVALMRSDQNADSVMSGPSGETLDLSLRFEADTSAEPTRLNVRDFRLNGQRGPLAAAGVADDPPLGRSRGASRSSSGVGTAESSADHSTRVRAEYARAASMMARARRQQYLIQTSFSVDVGETIVVGSSKLDGQGGKAVLVLFTAIP